MEKAIPAPKRIDIIDALRGFALAGIVIVHFVEQYTAAPPAEGIMNNAVEMVDKIIMGLIYFFLMGKFFALFSVLFGLSFYIQWKGAKSKNINFNKHFLLRMLILFVIGYIHSLFYRGDILTIYAMIGIFLPLFQNVKPKYLLILIGVVFIGFFRSIVFIIFGSSPIFGGNPMDFASPELLSYYTTLRDGSLMDVFRTNAVDGHLMKMEFQVGLTGRLYLTFAYFLLGIWLGHKRFFETLTDNKPLLKKMIGFGVGGIVLFTVLTGASFTLAGENPMDSWLGMIGLTMLDLTNLSMTLLIIASFCLIWMKKERTGSMLASYGRMALTNYFMQTIIGTAIYYGYGLGTLGTITNRWTLVIAILVIFLQMIFSHWWLQRFRFGPLEWLWRSLNYGKLQTFRKE